MENIIDYPDIFDSVLYHLDFTSLQYLLLLNNNKVTTLILPHFQKYYCFLDVLQKAFFIWPNGSMENIERIYDEYYLLHGKIPIHLWKRLGSMIYSYIILTHSENNRFANVELFRLFVKMSNKYSDLLKDLSNVLSNEVRFSTCVNYIVLKENPKLLELSKESMFEDYFRGWIRTNIVKFEQYCPSIDFYIIQFDVQGVFGNDVYYDNGVYYANPYTLWNNEQVMPDFIIDSMVSAIKKEMGTRLELPVVIKFFSKYESEPPADAIRNSNLKKKIEENEGWYLWTNIINSKPNFIAIH